MSWRRAFIFLALAVVGGCHDGGLKVPRVERVTEIRVYGINANLATNIRDPRRIDRIVTFINGRRSHWHIPDLNAPAPEVVAVLYDGNGRKYIFAAEPSHFENGPTYMLSRHATREEYQAFLQAIGVNEFHADNDENVHRP
jgi:hypothetical protein